MLEEQVADVAQRLMPANSLHEVFQVGEVGGRGLEVSRHVRLEDVVAEFHRVPPVVNDTQFYARAACKVLAATDVIRALIRRLHQHLQQHGVLMLTELTVSEAKTWGDKVFAGV